MNAIRKPDRNSKIFIFLIICALIFSSFVFLDFLSDDKKMVTDTRSLSEEKIQLDVVGNKILQKLVYSCSTDENIDSLEEFYEADNQVFGCFPSNTSILMSDGSKKDIKDVDVDDKIYSFDIVKKDFFVSKVISKYGNTCNGVYSINDEEFLTTDVLPILVRKPDGLVTWSALNPVKSSVLYPDRKCDLIEVGDELYSLENGWVEIRNIEYIDKEYEVFTLSVESGFHNFFANGFLVSNADDTFYVIEGFKEGIDLFYRYGYTIFNLSKVKNLTQMSYDELREKFDMPLGYDFRIIINVQSRTYSSTVDSTIYESDVSAVVSKNILIREGGVFYYGWVRIEVFVNR